MKKCTELYAENCKTLVKEIKEDLIKQRDVLCSWIGRINFTSKDVNFSCTDMQV